MLAGQILDVRGRKGLLDIKTDDFSVNFNSKLFFQSLKAVMTQVMERSKP